MGLCLTQIEFSFPKMRFCQINRGREKSNGEKGMLKNNGFRDRRSLSQAT